MLAALILTVAIGTGGTDVRETALHIEPTRLVQDVRNEALHPQLPNVGAQVDAARTWASYPMRPGRSVEAVAPLFILQSAAAADGDRPSARGIHLLEMPHVLDQQAVAQAIICADPWACFRQGYRDFGGWPEWEDRFVDVIDTCESGGHGWADTYPLYISRAQFDPASWATAVSATKLNDPANPYHVGANVAVWSNATDPGGSGGWPGCWRRTAGLDGLNYSE